MKVGIISLLGMVFYMSATAQVSLELDLDGEVGNGPDLVSVEVSDYISVDIWFTEGIGFPVYGWGVGLCNYDGSLEFQGAVYSVPDGWVTGPPGIYGPCVAIWADMYYQPNPIIVPSLIATATYHATVDNSFDDISIDPSSLYRSGGFSEFYFDNRIGASVQIGATSTEESSWGSVKTLFR